MEIPVMTSYPPTIGDSYGNGWKQLWKFFLELFLIGIVFFLFSIPMSLPSWFGKITLNLEDLEKFENPMRLPLIFFPYFIFLLVYGILLINPLKYGIKYAYLKAARGGENIEVRDMFSFTANYINCVFASLLSGFIIGIGVVFLIIPGIIFACKLAFVPYLVIDKKMDAVAAIKASWDMTNGHTVDIFVMGLLAIPICIIGFIAFFIGIIPAVMWVRMSFASLYHAVDRMKAPKM